jgi:hypothetical protein
MKRRNCHPERSEGAETLFRLPRSRSLPLSAAKGSLRMTVGFGLATALMTTSALAQVGHPPASSPYRDIRKGHTFAVTGGYFSGDGGEFGIGPHGGPVFGVRYDIRTASAIQLGLGIGHGSLDRFIVDPFVRLADRRSGPVRQSVTFAELDVQLNVTGGKSWRRVAPYVGAGGGIAFGGGTPADTSGYEFGNKIFLAPHAGVRVFFSDRIHLRAEARATFWKLKYPTTFQQEPVEEPGTAENPNAVIPSGNLDEWTTSSWLQAGLGYSFSL